MNKTIERCIDCRGTAAESAIQWECLPVKTFGGLPSGRLKAITIGLNPAFNDWWDETSRLWHDSTKRAATVFDFKKEKREDLTDQNCADAIRRRGEYFWNPNKKWHRYFESMEMFLARIDRRWSYVLGTVAHVDLAACPTKMQFRKIPDDAREALLKNCEKHFLQTLNDLPEKTVLLLNGDLPISTIQRIGRVEIQTPRELINLNGLSGFSGLLQLERKKFVFCGWNQSAANLSIPIKLELAFWARDHIKNQGGLPD
jgi:hypothetical protein